MGSSLDGSYRLRGTRRSGWLYGIGRSADHGWTDQAFDLDFRSDVEWQEIDADNEEDRNNEEVGFEAE